MTIRLADLLGSRGDGVDQDRDVFADSKDDRAARAALAAASGSLRAVHARTLVLACIAALMLMAGGALFGYPMIAVTIAPSGEPTSISAGAPHVSSAAVVPAVLRAHSPAPAAFVSPDAAEASHSATAPAVPARTAPTAAMSGIPGMMGTPVALTAPERVGSHSRPSMPTALSTADGSSETDNP